MTDAENSLVLAALRVTAIIVTYNSASHIRDCLDALLAANVRKIMVIDNDSNDDSRTIIQNDYPFVCLHASPVNLGFGNACNVGLASLDTEFALLVNPDAQITSDSVAELVAAADRYPDAGILGPAMFYADGQAGECQHLHMFAKRKKKNFVHHVTSSSEGDFCVGFLHGAVMLLRGQAIEQSGGFDPDIFLFYEDDEICLRMMIAGWSLIHVPSARVTHIGGASSATAKNIFWSKEWHMGWSRLHVERIYRSRAWPLAIALLLFYGLKVVGYALICHKSKIIRNAARFCGSIAALLKYPACSQAVKMQLGDSIKPQWKARKSLLSPFSKGRDHIFPPFEKGGRRGFSRPNAL